MHLLQRVLFVCSGNFYRSRFAEAVFNHEARLSGLGWTAFSRGIRPHLTEGNLSPQAEAALVALGITIEDTPGPPTRLEAEDLMAASLVIGVHRAEHETPLVEKFGAWVGRVQYWDVPDVHELPASEALPRLGGKVAAIVRSLAEVPVSLAGPRAAYAGEF